MEITTAFADPNVERVFAAFPQGDQGCLLALRELIFEVAGRTEGVGEIQETLKWGQPAYLTPQTKSGSTIRLGIPKKGGFAIYTHCQTPSCRIFKASSRKSLNTKAIGRSISNLAKTYR